MDLLCSQYGERLPYSVFELVICETDWLALRIKLRQVIDPTVDVLNICPLCAWCRSTILRQGTAALPPTGTR